MNKLIAVLLFLAFVPVGLCDESARATWTFRTARVTRGVIEATVRAKGTLEPEQVVEVGARVAGQIQKFGLDPRDPHKAIDYGSPVEEGTVLAQIDPTTYQVQVEQARATLKRAQAKVQAASAQSQLAEHDWSRIKQLGDKVAAPTERSSAQARYELARANVEVSKAGVLQAQAALKLAELNLAYCTIRSPLRGVIIDRRFNLGQTVAASPSAPSLFLIATDLKKLHIWASVPEADIGQVKNGQPASFTTDAFPGKVFRGKVAQVRLNATWTQDMVTYTVVISLDNDGKLLPYLTADVQIVVEQRQNVLLVPNAALRWRPEHSQMAPAVRQSFAATQADRKRSGRGLVWVQEKGLVQPVEVGMGLTDGTHTEILGGDLAEGKEIVIGAEAATPPPERGAARAAETKHLLAALEVEKLFVWPGPGSSGGVTFGTVAVNALTAADAEAIVHDCPAVKSAAPVVRARTQVAYDKHTWVPLYIYGTTPSYLQVRDWHNLKEGDPFTDGDVRKGANVCLLGQTIARELFGDASPVGKSMRLGLKGASFRVVGVLSRKGPNVMGLDQDDIVLAPWTAVEAAQSADKADADKKGPGATLDQLYPATPPSPRLSRKVDQIVVRARSEAKVPAASREISELLRRRHRIRPGQADDFHVGDMLQMKALKSTPLGR
jgi:HlyD family secretion protein